MKMAPKRFSGVAADCAMAVIAGTMASNNGSARVAPTPRRTVRRDIDFLVMNIVVILWFTLRSSHFSVRVQVRAAIRTTFPCTTGRTSNNELEVRTEPEHEPRSENREA